ncbi:hypothetical protein TNCV_3901931 [Trichonephila clavipes]|nr:hypothetical protein TNCV_3901931 [Trichonephila clavipes]
MLHISGSGLEADNLLICLYAPRTNPNPLDFFWKSLELLVYEISVAIVKELMSQIVIMSSSIARTLYLLEYVR